MNVYGIGPVYLVILWGGLCPALSADDDDNNLNHLSQLSYNSWLLNVDVFEFSLLANVIYKSDTYKNNYWTFDWEEATKPPWLF